MPLYEYQCTACGKLTEKRQKFSDPEITECPHCGGKLERTITAPAVQFKGGGWYADGYGNRKPAATATSDSSAGSEAGKSTASNEKSSGEGGGSTSSTPAATPASTPASASAPSTTK